MQVRLSKYRSAIQLVFLGLFIFLFAVDLTRWGMPIPSQLFLYADPLIAIVVLITGAPFVAWTIFSLVVVFISALFGRVFCSYACPVGTIIDWFSSLSNLFKIKNSTFRKLKVLPLAVLALVLVVSIFNTSLAIALDPVSLMTRTLTTLEEIIKIVAISGSDITGTFIAELFGDGDGGFHGSNGSQGSSNAYTPRILDSSGWILGLFAIVIVFNLLGKRFWCRYLCPLGALLGLFSRIPLYRRKVNKVACVNCEKCSTICSMDAITKDMHATDPTNCILCLECRDTCSQNAISWGLKSELTDEIPSRRTALAVIGGTVAAAAITPAIGYADEHSLDLLRPPGVSNEELFNQKCIRCGQCISKCPTKVLQPSLLQYGVGSLWTPHLDFSVGVCDYYCNMCGSCPTGAIELLMLEKKQTFVIGIAEINKTTCIRYKNGFGCGLCAKVCPVPGGAISTDITYVNFGTDRQRSTGMPISVNEEKCIGCGVCEAVCPVKGEKAIKVVRRRVGDTALKGEPVQKPTVYD